jgi:hypothetical protein
MLIDMCKDSIMQRKPISYFFLMTYDSPFINLLKVFNGISFKAKKRMTAAEDIIEIEAKSFIL